MSVPPGSQRGHLDIFELLWRGPYGSHGRAPCRAAISIRSCFSGSEEIGQGEGRENATDSLWRNSQSQKDVLWNMSDNLSETLRSAVSWRLFFRSDCNVTLISHSACRVRSWYLIHTTHSQSILCRNRITAITSVLWHNTKQRHLQKIILTSNASLLINLFQAFVKTDLTLFTATHSWLIVVSVDVTNRLPFSKRAFLFLHNVLTRAKACRLWMSLLLVPCQSDTGGLAPLFFPATRQRIFSLPSPLCSAPV